MNPGESAFTAIARVIGEPANGFDNLRIIAKDTARTMAVDRETIRSAADELEASQRAHLATHRQLIETQQKLIAVNERLLESERQLLAVKKPVTAPFEKLQMSSGWVRVMTCPMTIPLGLK